MTILISDSCISCGACVPVCPESALFLGADPKVMVDHLKCVDCGECVPVCP
ncbi:MAG: 4Fe-4S binding protein, partial [Candidatus Margulisiibacteriota bacterium]